MVTHLAQSSTYPIVAFFQVLHTPVSKSSPVPAVMYHNKPQVESLA